jgi:hypothetical protein
VRDEETDGRERDDGRRGEGRVRERRLKEETRNLRVRGGDGLGLTADAQDTVLDTSDNLGHASLAVGQLAD